MNSPPHHFAIHPHPPKRPGEDRDEQLPLGVLKNAIAVDYDFADNCVFWADIGDRDIKRACLDGVSANQRLVGLNGTVEGIAYDWISQNLYWVETTTVKIETCRKVRRKGKGDIVSFVVASSFPLWFKLVLRSST